METPLGYMVSLVQTVVIYNVGFHGPHLLSGFSLTLRTRLANRWTQLVTTATFRECGVEGITWVRKWRKTKNVNGRRVL